MSLSAHSVMKVGTVVNSELSTTLATVLLVITAQWEWTRPLLEDTTHLKIVQYKRVVLVESVRLVTTVLELQAYHCHAL